MQVLNTEFDLVPFQMINIPLEQFNTTKANKNLVSFTAALVLFITCICVALPAFAFAQHGLIHEAFIMTYLYVITCTLPVAYPSIFFMFEPNNFLSVLELFSEFIDK